MIPLSFNVNCTIPPTITHYVSGVSTRGTLNIVWSSLSVLALCVWSTQHLNVPPQWRPSEKDKTIGTKMSQKWRKFFRHIFLFERSFRWMVINLMSPEFMTAKALLDLLSAKDMYQQLRPWARDDGVDWSIAHTYYANMGAFIIRFGGQGESMTDMADGEDIEFGQRLSEIDRTRTPSTGRDFHTQDAGEPYLREVVRFDEEQHCLFRQAGGALECICDGNADRPRLCGGVVMQSLVSDTSEARTQENSRRSAENNRHGANADVLAARRRGMVLDVYQVAEDTTVEQRDSSAETNKSFGVFVEFSQLLDTEVAQNMKRHLHKLLGNKTWGVVRYLERIHEFRAGFGFDWEIDQQNREAVFKAFDKYGQYDVRSIRLLNWYHNVSALQGNIWYVDAAQLLFARQAGIITSLPSLSHEVLGDQIKDNFLVKCITLAQIIWLTLQLIVRQTEGFPSSQLEIVALAFAACSLFTCILMWEKPQGVEACSYVTASRRPNSLEIQTLGAIGPRALGQNRVYPWMCNNTLHTHIKGGDWTFLLGMEICATLFGGIHCLSWNSHFPTPIERLLWRMSSLVLTIEPSIISISVVFLSLTNNRKRKVGDMWRAKPIDKRILTVLLHILFYSYSLSRLYLIVETIRSLVYLPPEVFEATNWPNYLPHWM